MSLNIKCMGTEANTVSRSLRKNKFHPISQNDKLSMKKPATDEQCTMIVLHHLLRKHKGVSGIRNVSHVSIAMKISCFLKRTLFIQYIKH